jgi:hypothetical protein
MWTRLAVMTYICNSSSIGGTGKEDCSPRPVLGKKQNREVLNNMTFSTKVDRKEVTKFYCKGLYGFMAE